MLTVVESYLPTSYYPGAYAAKAVVVSAALVVCRRTLADIRPEMRVVLPSVGVGLLVCVLWFLIDKNVPYAHIGARTAFDPTSLQGTIWWAIFMGIRLLGLILLVPVMEEVFWRSFLLRYLTAHDFQKLPVGTFSAFALWAMVAASALAHPEWVVGAVASIAYALWLRRTGSLFAAVVAHAATNAALGAYVLATGSWQYW